MKKLLALTLAMAMCLALVACGGSKTSTAPAASSAAPAASNAPAEAKPVIDYTKKPINVIVPFAAGGGQHVLATAVNGATPDYNMVITNVTGGGGATGIMETLHSKNDGWTVCCSTINNVAAGAWNGAYPDPDAWNKLTCVGSVAGDRMIVIASKASGFTSLEDIVAAAKAAPGEVSVTGATANSYTQAVAEMWMEDLGIECNYVPFDGEQAARNATMGGQVDVCIFGVGAAQTAIDSGDCVGICMLSAERSSFFPDVPTIAEVYPELDNYDFTVYRGYYMPQDTDPAIVAEFEKVLAQCVEDPSFKETCDSLFLEITYMDSAEMTEALKKMVDDCQKMYEIMNG